MLGILLGGIPFGRHGWVSMLVHYVMIECSETRDKCKVFVMEGLEKR